MFYFIMVLAHGELGHIKMQPTSYSLQHKSLIDRLDSI